MPNATVSLFSFAFISHSVSFLGVIPYSPFPDSKATRFSKPGSFYGKTPALNLARRSIPLRRVGELFFYGNQYIFPTPYLLLYNHISIRRKLPFFV